MTPVVLAVIAMACQPIRLDTHVGDFRLPSYRMVHLYIDQRKRVDLEALVRPSQKQLQCPPRPRSVPILDQKE